MESGQEKVLKRFWSFRDVKPFLNNPERTPNDLTQFVVGEVIPRFGPPKMNHPDM